MALSSVKWRVVSQTRVDTRASSLLPLKGVQGIRAHATHASAAPLHYCQAERTLVCYIDRNSVTHVLAELEREVAWLGAKGDGAAAHVRCAYRALPRAA